MATIARGKTAGEHQAEEIRIHRRTRPVPLRSDRTPGLSDQDLREMEEAMQDLEETHGDFSLDH